ncbi:MAG: glutathione S-transferase N-terminal domain-containing protein [Gammaproteobacteria bacterium]|nr:glutathione S-transferase N-terminal domain-containing protein [Gammaproteobacteria bacterium]NVK88916.1 glutathione S-transferase N-terminal domain-containing protein [Gammaproteobacteria bacterium]
MKTFELFYFPSCPYCQMVLGELNQLTVAVELRNIMENIDYRNELMAGGGKTQVPCLKIVDAESVTWMYESRDIIHYLQQQAS